MTSLTIPHLPETIFNPIFGNESERFGQRNNRCAQTLFVGLTFRSQILIGRSNFIPLFLAKRSGSYRKAKWIMAFYRTKNKMPPVVFASAPIVEASITDRRQMDR